MPSESDKQRGLDADGLDTIPAAVLAATAAWLTATALPARLRGAGA